MALSTSRAAEGWRPDGGRDGKNGLVARGCRDLQGPGDQVEGIKTAIAGQAVEDGDTESCLDRKSKTGTREDDRVQRAVEVGLGVVDGRGGQYTEGEGGGSRKQSNGGTGLKIRR